MERNQPALTQLQSSNRRRSTVRWIAGSPLLCSCSCPEPLGIAAMHPYELSYFSEIVGGLKRSAER